MARILITGAARGIGLELAAQLAQRGDEVIAAVRESSPELRELPVDIIESIDVTQHSDREALRQKLGERPLDVLLHNAGILTQESLDDLDCDRIRAQFEVNSVAPLALTGILRGHLHRGSRVVIITSRMGCIGDNDSGGMYGYRMSKAAANMAGKSLAVDLHPQGIAVGLFHPGLVATRMTGFQGIEPAAAAGGLIRCLDALTLESSGVLLHAQTSETLPW